jgi:hypothetical protein
MMSPDEQRAGAAQLRAFNPDSRAAALYELAARMRTEQARLVADYRQRLEVAAESP